MYDVAVVGGGHNGLCCAAYLARAGKRVVVLEANEHVGGFTLTGEVPGAPGFLMNTYGFEFPFVELKPSVVHELELHRHGLHFTAPDPHNTYLSPTGTQWSMYHSLERTVASIAKLCPRRDAGPGWAGRQVWLAPPCWRRCWSQWSPRREFQSGPGGWIARLPAIHRGGSAPGHRRGGATSATPGRIGLPADRRFTEALGLPRP